MTVDDGVLIWQLNCHKSSLVHDQLGMKMKHEKVKPLLALQEPSAREKLTGYTRIQNEGGRIRACIMVPDELSFVFMARLSSPDTSTGIIKCKNDDVMLISAYMDYSDTNIDVKLWEALEYAKEKGIDAIVCCDSNSQSTLWGNRKSNHREDLVLDLLVTQGLEIANVGNSPTYRRVNVKSVIDLTLHTNGINVIDWMVSDADMLSDHQLITFRIDKESINSIKRSRALKKANWHRFRNILKSKLCFTSKHFWTEDDLEKESKRITKEITDALDVVAPLKQRESRGDSLWGLPEFCLLCKKVKAARKRHYRYPTEENFAKYKEYRQELKRLKRNHVAGRWQEFCEGMVDPKDLARFSKIKCQRHKLQSIKENGTVYTDAKDVTNILRKAHFPGSITLDPDSGRDPDSIRKCDVYGISTNENESVTFVKEVITCEKVLAAIGSFGSFKAAGPDGIAPIVLQNLPVDVIHRYVEMFRASILLGYLPNHWRDSSVVFIPKTGRPSYEEAKAFRPITLASFQLKSLEKLLLWRIQDRTLSQNPESKFQHAFRKHYSTDTALSVVVDKAEQGLWNKQATLAVFLDLKGAFDHVNQNFVIESMKLKGVEQKICNWYRMYLEERKSLISLGDCREEFRTSLGVPQGGLISPTAFALCIDGYLEKLNQGGATTIAFADDLTVLSSGPDVATIGNIVQGKLKILEEWSRKSGLTFNVSKTNAMIFTRKTKFIKPKLRISGEEIEYVEQVKYLGVHLTPRLNWSVHIKEKISSCKKLLYMLLSMIRKSFQMTLKGLRWLYTMCVRPKLLYASHIWGTNLNGKQREELQRINSLGCRLIAPCWKSTPKMTLEIIWNMIPLHILAKGVAIGTFLRIKPLIRKYLKGDIGYQKGHLKELDDECKKKNLENEVEEKVNKTFWERNYQVNQFDDLDWITLLEDMDIRYTYTDGSMLNGVTGAGCAIRKNAEVEYLASISLGTDHTVYQGEMKAVELALDYLLSQRLHEVVTEFRVDSQSVLSRLRSGRATTKLETRCIEKLELLTEKTKVILRWVKSHKGLQGNELADNMAKQGTLEESPLIDVPLPSSFRKRKIKEYMHSLWKEEWKQLKGSKFNHRTSKFWLAESNPEDICKEMLKYKRNEVSLAIGLLSGHNMTKEHLQRAKKLEQEEEMDCRLCGQNDETNEHLLECRELKMERVLAFGTSDKQQIKNHWKVKYIMEFCSNEKVKQLLRTMD